MRRHPAVWNWASGVGNRKPGKDNSTKLKASRSLSLLRCMGNVVERLVAEILPYVAQRRGLLSDGQFGRSKGQSSIDAVAIILKRAHAAWTNGHITGVLLMDIMAAFPSVAKGRLVNLMKVREMDGDLIRWMKSFDSGHPVEIKIEGNAMERHPVEAGVPQGFPVSPILFAIYTSGLIKWVEQYVPAKGQASVDDPSLVVPGSTVNLVVMIAERCAPKCVELASR